MNGLEYQNLAMRTNDHNSSYRLAKALMKSQNEEKIDFGGIMMSCLGLSGEIGEFNDMLKKVIFHEAEFDEEHAKKELGDICWYVAMMCESFGWSLEDIMQMNIDKLRKRYPNGFDVNRANHREVTDI